MLSYICITHALGNRTEAERLSDTLIAYGFSCRRVHEASEPVLRARTLFGAARVLALTSPEADAVGTVADDLTRLMKKGHTPICVSLGDNAVDRAFCSLSDGIEADNRLNCVPYPVGAHPDARSVGLFIHRLLICHLAPMEGVFSALRCRQDDYGRAVTHAVAALRGDAAAAYALGCAYEGGVGVPVLEEEAAAWITRASDMGHVDAQLHLGELCLSGWGTEPDEARAVSLFSAVAESGDRRGEYRMGLCYLNGVGVVTDPIRAVYHLRRAARWGYPPALFRLSLLIRDGIGVPADPHLALQQMYEACCQGAAAEAERHGAASTSSARSAEDLPREEWESDVDFSALSALSDLTEDASRAADALAIGGGPSAPEFPLPPTLYGVRASRRGRHCTLRTMRPRLLAASARRHPTATAVEVTPRSFARFTYAISHRPEGAWIGALTRTAPSALGGGQMQGHPALHMDTYDMAMGVRFDLSEVAVAIGGLLESGGRGTGVRKWFPNPARAMVWYRYALRRGNPEALFRLAEAYRRGHGTLPDAAFAVELYRISADWGDARGQFSLAVACERGIGTEVDVAEAIRRYEHAAAAGYPPAENNLGGCYEFGIGVAPNILLAVEWYARAAGADLPEAQCRLGLCYECGRGVPVDLARAFELYEKAAAGGNAYALYRLGVACDRGQYPLAETAQDDAILEEVAADMLDVSYRDADLHFDADLQRDAAPHQDAGPSPVGYTSSRAEAVRRWTRAAECGVADAAYAMAMCYSHGHGVRPDRERAMLYLRDAAERGCLQAVTRLALCTLEGNGTVPNRPLAVTLFRRAVRMWHERKGTYLTSAAPLPLYVETPAEAAADALYMLGYCLLEGIGERRTEQEDEAHRIRRALPLFSEAANMGHVGAHTLQGDLYAYGKLPLDPAVPAELTPAEKAEREQVRRARGREMSRVFYLRAVRAGSARRAEPCPLSDEDIARAAYAEYEHLLPPSPTPDPRVGGLLASGADALSRLSIPALLTLAGEVTNERVGRRTPAADGTSAPDPDKIRAWEQAWKYLSCAAEQGSSEARLGMARCAYFGMGTDKNIPAALRYLQEAVALPESGARAAMWLGDFYRTGWGAANCRTEEADDAYLRGLSRSPSGSEVGPYILPARMEEQKQHDTEARAHLLYRLATFRSIYLSDKAHDGTPVDDAWRCDRRETFSYFAEAVLLGHPAARKDWARIFNYERNYPAATAPAKGAGGERVRRKRLFFGRARRRSATPAMRDHRTWLADYYTDLWLEPMPFEYALRSVALASNLPAHMTGQVTADMEANALNYLGECFFEGRGITRSRSSAVLCFREVAAMGKAIPRGVAVPVAIVWAQYSLGWCLLKGQGTPRREMEAVRWLSKAARSHPDACLLLGRCHEEGIGVDKTDLREAIKYYRRAAHMGNPEAPAKVRETEMHLRAIADAEEKRRRQEE